MRRISYNEIPEARVIPLPDTGTTGTEFTSRKFGGMLQAKREISEDESEACQSLFHFIVNV